MALSTASSRGTDLSAKGKVPPSFHYDVFVPYPGLQLATANETPCLVVGKVYGTASISFDELNGGIEALSADVMFAEVEQRQTLRMVSDHFDGLLYRGELTCHCVVAPGIEVAFGRDDLSV